MSFVEYHSAFRVIDWKNTEAYSFEYFEITFKEVAIVVKLLLDFASSLL